MELIRLKKQNIYYGFFRKEITREQYHRYKFTYEQKKEIVAIPQNRGGNVWCGYRYYILSALNIRLKDLD